MPNSYLPRLGTLLSALLLSACYPSSSQPTEASGRVLGWTCHEGLIIEVDPAYDLGRPVRTMHENHRDSIVGRHAIAAVNNMDFRRRRGQWLRFRYVPVQEVDGDRVCPGWHERPRSGLPYYHIQITDSAAAR